jgi:hypothetical protein
MIKYHRIVHGQKVYHANIRPTSPAHNELEAGGLAAYLDILIHARSIRTQEDRQLPRYEMCYTEEKLATICEDAREHEEESMQNLMAHISTQPELREIAAFWLATKGRALDEIGQFNPLDTQRLAQLGIELTPQH